MPIARRRIVNPAVTRWYHCISECVRQTCLLSADPKRQRWLEHRLEELVQIFAIAVSGFSIMGNHLHTLIRLDPQRARKWSDEEVARRWGRLFPPRDKRRQPLPVNRSWIQARLKDPAWVVQTRARLQDLGWFMKCLKEPLARLANAEDGTRGAFFASRYKSVAILDERALLTACAYIDLNPLAAGITKLPEESPFTSILARVAHAFPRLTREELLSTLRGEIARPEGVGQIEQTHWLCPLEDRSSQGAPREGMLPGFSLPRYLLLVDYSARLLRAGKAHLSADVAPIFERLQITAEVWQHRLQQLTSGKKLAGGMLWGRMFATSREALSAAATRLGFRRLANLGGRMS